MHVLGKVLAVFAVMGAIASVIFTTKVLHVRNEWTRKVNDSRAQYEKTVDPLDVAQRRLSRLEHQWRRISHSWGPAWDNLQVLPIPPADPNAPNATYLIDIRGLGTTSGLKPGQIIHAFAPSADGGRFYVGPFRVADVRDQQTRAAADWPLRQSEKNDWRPAALFWQIGGPWRVRGAVPTAETETLIHYAQMLIKKDEQYAATVAYRDAQNEAVKVAQEHRAYREKELHGDDSLEDRRDVLPDYLIDGLVKAVANADENRNDTQLVVDELRHELKRLYDDVVAIQKRNRQRAATLPGAELAAPKETTAAVDD